MDISIETLVEKGVGAISISRILNIPLQEAQYIVVDAKVKNTQNELRKKCVAVLAVVAKCDESMANRIFDVVVDAIRENPAAVGLKRGSRSRPRKYDVGETAK